MKVKYSPILSNRDLQFEKIDENNVKINGIDYCLPELKSMENESITICNITNWQIIEAEQKDGEWYITILEEYTKDPPIDDQEYNTI